MIKQKIKFSEIESEERKMKGCFTEASTVTLGIPSFTEKAKIKTEFGSVDQNDHMTVFNFMNKFVLEVDCKAVDGQAIRDLDNLLAYADGALLINYLTELLVNGFVPKKS
jgi:hypothetical protein